MAEEFIWLLWVCREEFASVPTGGARCHLLHICPPGFSSMNLSNGYITKKSDYPYKVIYIQGVFENKHILLCLLSQVIFLVELIGK